MYGAGIFVSLIGGAIYNNNLAFILCFFLVALFLIGMVQTHSNMKKIKIEKLSLFLSPSQGRGYGVIWIKSENSEGHSQLRIRANNRDDKIDTIIQKIYPKSLFPHYFNFQTGDWGNKQIKKIKISTRYPFGFFYVWRNFKCLIEYQIYPRPEGNHTLDSFQAEGIDQGLYYQRKGDDFSEHRKYRDGESQKHIDWKAYARGRPLLVKKFEEGQKQTFLIDYAQTKGSQDVRARQVSQWIHQFEKNQSLYAFKLGDKKVSIGTGEKHKVACLKLLSGVRGQL